jgi:drug/metabolite transporter (DMT)-like permease
MIMALEPLFIMLGAYILYKERNSASAMLGMAIAIFGVVFIGWGDIGLSAENLKGDMLSVGGTVAVAAHLLIGQKLVAAYAFLFVQPDCIHLCCHRICCLQSGNKYTFLRLSGPGLGHLCPAGGGANRIRPYFWFNWLLQYASATTVSMNILGEPVGASILAFLLLGEQLSGLQWAGGVLVMAGLGVYLYSGRRKALKLQEAMPNAS